MSWILWVVVGYLSLVAVLQLGQAIGSENVKAFKQTLINTVIIGFINWAIIAVGIYGH